MEKIEIFCENCEAEFYIETDCDIVHCVSCGEKLNFEVEEESWEEDE